MQQLLLNCDWLGLSLHVAGEVKPIKGYIWKEYTATNVWNKRRVLWTENGDKVLTLLSEPRSSIINCMSALLEVENEWLYHGGGYSHVLEVLGRGVNYHITGISRLDLAVDFCPTEAQKDIIMGLATGEYYIKGKSNQVPWWGISSDKHLHPMWRGKKIPYDQSWGHKTTDIKWKLYYKTKELWDAGGGRVMMKPYIADQWRINGMDLSNVWRVEVSIKKLNNYCLYDQQLNMDVVERDFEELFRQLYQSRFEVKLNEGHKDRTNDKSVTFLPMGKITYTLKKREPKNTRERNGRITLLRHLIQSLDDEAVLFDEVSRNAVYEHIATIIQNDNLDNYFMAMTGKWFDEYVAAKEDESLGGVRVPIQREVNSYDIQPDEKRWEEVNPETEQRYWQWVSEKTMRELDR